jgi:hypothetical protein
MDLPQFDQPQQPETSAPSRKPRRKKRSPVKAKNLRPPKAVPKRRRKRKAKPVKAEQTGGRFTPEVYRLIGELMGLTPASRSLVLGIVQGLTK